MIDYSPLPFTEYPNRRERFKPWMQGYDPCIPAECYFLPPFQKRLPRTGALVTSFILRPLAGGADIDVLADLVATGLETIQPVGRDYDLIIYPSTVRINTAGLAPTKYEAIMSVNGKLWYSETISFTKDLNRYIKLEWCHNGAFEYRDGYGTFEYTSSGFGSGYKNYMWLRTQIAKPNYIDNSEDIRRGGFNLNQFHYTDKEFRMAFEAAETRLDALKIVGQHDEVKIYDGVLIYHLNSFRINPAWTDKGEKTTTEALFRINETVTEISSARGPSSETCEIAAGTCIDTTGSYYRALAELQPGNADYIGGYYFDIDGVQTNLEDGDYILSGNDGSRRLYQFSAGPTYTLVDLTGIYSKIYLANTNEYLYHRGTANRIRRSSINGVNLLTNPNTYYGECSDDLTFEIWVEDAGGYARFDQIVDNTDLDLGVQVDDSGQAKVLLRGYSLKCGLVSESFIDVPTVEFILSSEDLGVAFYLTSADTPATINAEDYLSDKNYIDFDQLN